MPYAAYVTWMRLRLQPLNNKPKTCFIGWLFGIPQGSLLGIAIHNWHSLLFDSMDMVKMFTSQKITLFSDPIGSRSGALIYDWHLFLIDKASMWVHSQNVACGTA